MTRSRMSDDDTAPAEVIPFRPGQDYSEQPELEAQGPTDAPPLDGPIPLGYDRGTYFYLSRETRQVAMLSWAQHTKAGLLSLASLPHFWERTRFMGKRGVTWDEAGDWLMRQCEGVGVFDPNRLRGRGAWIDAGRSVVHLGDRIVVDGREMRPGDLDSRYIYERAVPMAPGLPQALRAGEAKTLLEICKKLRFERGVHAYLMAGFIAVGPICGALAWRPSIWLTGPSGSGKTYVLETIVRGSLGDVALAVQSKTTEAGIRQTLGSDGRPVVFDEAEQEDIHARQRMQSVLDLVRQSSSEGGAEIVKGSQTQSGAKRYRIRSAFCFCSINVGIEQYADETRITVLPLAGVDKNDREARDAAQLHFNALDRLVVETITPDFAMRLLARSVLLLPQIMENHRVFSSAVAAHLGNQRVGQQLGALLAGAWSLIRSRVAGYDEALEWVKSHDWTGSSAVDAETDEAKLLDFLKQQPVRVTLAGGQISDRLVGEIMEACLTPGGAHGLGRQEAMVCLLRMGIRFDPEIDPKAALGQSAHDAMRRNLGVAMEGFWFANSHVALKRILAPTPWASQWGRTLSRIPGAARSEPRTVNFGKHSSMKACFVPVIQVMQQSQGLTDDDPG